MLDEKVLHVSIELVKHMDKAADENLPKEIADIVKFHTKGATAGALAGAIPGIGAVVSFLTSAGFLWGMYARINKAIGIKLSENILETIASGVITNLAASIVGPLIASSILSVIPFVGSIGSIIVMGATVYGLTMASGIIYLKILTNIFGAGEDPSNLTVDAFKNISDEIIKEFDIKGFMEKAKKEFKDKKEEGEFDEE